MRTDDGLTTAHWRRNSKLPAWELELHERLGVTVMERNWRVVGRCDCPWCASRRAARARAEWYKRSRNPDIDQRYDRERSLPAVEKLRRLKARGVSGEQVESATAGALCKSSFYHYVNGSRECMHKSTYDAAMALPEDMEYRRHGQGHVGDSCVDSTGTLRRVDALNTKYSTAWMMRMTGIKVSNLTCYRPKQVTRSTAEDIKSLYDKFADTDPLANGMAYHAFRLVQERAKRLNLPGPICWDDDTIDDPDAIAQYTGKCGSYSGYHQHQHWGIPPCPPCIKAAHEYNVEKGRRRAEAAKRLGESRV